MNTFGSFVKHKRVCKKTSLRSFCKEINSDPSDWSRIERDLQPAPQNTTKLYLISDKLDLSPEDTDELLMLARLSAGRLPDSIRNNPDIMPFLPILLKPDYLQQIIKDWEVI